MQVTFICESCDTSVILEPKTAAFKIDDIPRCKACKQSMVKEKKPSVSIGGAEADNQIMQAINSYRQENPHTRMAR